MSISIVRCKMQEEYKYCKYCKYCNRQDARSKKPELYKLSKIKNQKSKCLTLEEFVKMPYPEELELVAR